LENLYLDEFLLLFSFFFIGWVLFAFILHFAFSTLEFNAYNSKIPDKKLAYVSWWISVMHSLLVPWMCAYYMFFTCETGFTLSNQQCRDHPVRFAVLPIAISNGFMASDFFLLCVFREKMMLKDKQLAVHHFLVSYGLMAGVAF
jgi:hypothetical protein